MAGWVRPLASAWNAKKVGPVDILLLPCSFATGQEERIAHSLEGVDRVYRPKDYLKLFLDGGRAYRDGALLHLGGDLMYSALLSWRHGLRAWSYMWARPWWDRAFCGYFTKDDWGVHWLKKRRIPATKIFKHGDLVLDSVRQHICPPLDPHHLRPLQLSYMPGSRAVEVSSLTPLFLEVHQKLIKRFPKLTGVLHLSPYLPPNQIKKLLTSPPDPKFGGISGHLDGNELKFDGGNLRVATYDSYDWLSRSTLALSIPGTKTAEAGYLRTPVLTITPLNRPEHLPSIGLLGLLDFLPGGNHLKGRIMMRAKPKIGLLGQPNILAGKALLPEILDRVSSSMLAETLESLLPQDALLLDVRKQLDNLYSWKSHPAQNMIQTILGTLA